MTGLLWSELIVFYYRAYNWKAIACHGTIVAVTGMILYKIHGDYYAFVDFGTKFNSVFYTLKS